ncbi:MAG: nucleoside monophosphate kinase [Patescibacteria group bacterium]
MKILLLGPQGSGKSTQGKLLAEYFKTPFIVTGDILREIASSDTEKGKRIKQLLTAGNLVDDETVAKLIRERIERDDSRNGFILDGYPRTLEQAKKVEDLNFDKAIYFKVSQDVALDRLLKRGREDDTKDLIKKRLEIYFEQTEPLLKYYKNKGILLEISGEGEIKDIQDSLREGLNK